MVELQARTFEARYDVQFDEAWLGNGKDGVVLFHQYFHAVKFFFDPANYRRELRAYQALLDAKIHHILGHEVPQLILWDDELLAIEMTVVSAPFVLDFASAYSDEEVERLGFTDEVWTERESHWAEIFGDRWPDAMAIRGAFHAITGLQLLDLSLNNIRFA